MWPFTGGIESLWLALFLLTWALHAVFVGYVVVGTGYALVRPTTPLAEQVRDRLPVMLGCGITAGVAPLLFIQLLYQRRFYTGNLLLGPRWMLIVPALVVGFYALYVAKASNRWRRPALAAGLGAFTFVAWSWTELHQLMMTDAAWRDFYTAGHRVFVDGAIPIRVVTWLAAAVALFATVAAWSTSDRKRLAILALVGIAIASASGVVLGLRASHDIVAHGWLYILGGGVLATIAGWLWTYKAPAGAGLVVATSGTTTALIAGAVVRESARLAMLEPSHATASGGLAVFVVTLVCGIAAVAWIVRTVRAA